MGLFSSWCRRRDDPTGKDIKTFLDAVGAHIQAISLVDEDGNQLYVFPISDNDGSITVDSLAEHQEGTVFDEGEDYGTLALGVRGEDRRYRPLLINEDGSLAVGAGPFGAVTVTQLIRALLNCNATIQIAGVDVGPANLVPVDVANNVETTFDHGSNSAIGAAATQFIVASTPAVLGVEVKAADDNTEYIYVGNADVTAATADATDGMELGPGESILVRIDDVNKLYGITTAAPQRVFWLRV